MSDSSTEKPSEQNAQPASDSGKKTVPVEAVAKERAEKRAARAEAGELRRELDELKAQIPNLDMDKLIQALAEITTTTAESAVASALRPVQDEVSKWKTAASLGLSEEQAEIIGDVKQRYPGIADAAALAVARTEKPDAFPIEAPSVRRVHGGPPPGGDSPYRTSSQNNEFVDKMRAAQSHEERQHWATQEFFRRINLRRPST